MATSPTEPQEPATPRRPFRLSDAMILLVVLVAAVAWDRDRLRNPRRATDDLFPLQKAASVTWRLASMLANNVDLVPPVLALGSLGVLVLRFQRPMPPLRQIAGQPGIVACAVSSLMFVPAVLALLALHYGTVGALWKAWEWTRGDLNAQNLDLLGAIVGGAVLVSWIGLLLSRRWLPELSWIDRLGRLLGLGWIAMILGGALRPVLEFIRLVS